MLEVGQSAPSFQLTDDQNNTANLTDYQGHPLALFFYPKADTPG